MKQGTETFDEQGFRAVLGRFPTGVAVVTTRDPGGQVRGVTVNSFSSVSLEPPLILFCLGKSAFQFSVFAKAAVFAVNILADGQQQLSDRFAREAPEGFEGLSTTAWWSGSPVLEGCLAALDCEREAIHDAGDHLVLVGRVRALGVMEQGEPLVYCDGRYRRLSPGS